MAKYDAIQTFFVPRDRVNGSPYCFLTGIDLYFKAKPDALKSISGILNPGVSVHLCPVEGNHEPKPDNILTDSLVRLSYDEIPILQYQVVQKDVIDTETLQSYAYSPLYTDAKFKIVVPKDSLLTVDPRYFDFAPIDSTATLFFNAKGSDNKGGNYNVSSSTKGNFIQASSATYPGISKLSSTEKQSVGPKMYLDSAEAGRGAIALPDWSYGRGTNEIKGVGKFTWNHKTTDSGRYTIQLGAGKGCSVVCILRYASAIKTDSALSGSIKVPGISSGSKVFGNAAKVLFDTPVIVKTDTLYGIVVDYEDNGYQLWTNKQGESLIGTIGQSGSNLSPGASGKGDGKYFDYTNDQLRAINDQDLMFEVFAAKFKANTADVEITHRDYEFITVGSYSLTGNSAYPGEFVYQDYGNTVANVTHGFTGSGFFKQGTVNVDTRIGTESASYSALIGTNTVFTQDFGIGDYIVVTDLTRSNTDIRQVSYIANNTYLTTDQPLTFTNTAAFVKKTAIAKVFDADYGTNNMILFDTNANSSVKFQSSGIAYVTITVGGSFYTNTDILRVYSGGSTLNATAAVVTNSAGGIVALRFSNVGAGFSSAPNFIVSNSTVLTSNSSAGSGATFTANNDGSYIFGETSLYSANLISVDNRPISVFDPDIKLNGESIDTELTIQHNFAYLNGGNYYVNTSFLATTSDGNNYITKYSGLMMSRSNEVNSPTYLYNSDKSSVMKVRLNAKKPYAASSGGLYVSPILHTDMLNVFTYQYDVNSDYTNETTRSGNAHSKYVSNKISFANNKIAEDICVLMNAYKPSGTDIKVYAKIYHTADGEAYTNKSWSALELIDGSGLQSSKTNSNDVIALTYGFPKYPEVLSTLTGSVTVGSGSATITGVGTSLSTDLANNDLIRIYDPLQSNTNYFVAIATSIANTTSMTINSTTTNSIVIGSGFKIDRLKYKTAAFTNPQNYNIVRYYASTNVELDGYNVMAVKIVLLSNNINLVPEVDDISVIGVSA